MPLLIVKMFAGRTPEQKDALIDNLSQAVQDALGTQPSGITIDIQDIPKDEWDEKVKNVDILPRKDEIPYLYGEKKR